MVQSPTIPPMSASGTVAMMSAAVRNDRKSGARLCWPATPHPVRVDTTSRVTGAAQVVRVDVSPAARDAGAPSSRSGRLRPRIADGVRTSPDRTLTEREAATVSTPLRNSPNVPAVRPPG